MSTIVSPKPKSIADLGELFGFLEELFKKDKSGRSIAIRAVHTSTGKHLGGQVEHDAEEDDDEDALFEEIFHLLAQHLKQAKRTKEFILVEYVVR